MADDGLYTHIVIPSVNININNYQYLFFLVLSNKSTKNSWPIQSQMSEKEKSHFYETQALLLHEFNNCPTRCDLFSLLHFCRQLYMFRVLTPIIRSSYNCNYSFWYWL